jgi:hypothetical protein
MERRETHRTRRRVPCLFQYEGHVHNALVVDLSVGGLFLQTDTAINPGTELTLRLRGELFEDLQLRGRVVRRRFTPTVIATMIRRGVGIRILSAPPGYYDALGAAQESKEPAWAPLEALESEVAPSEPVRIEVANTPAPLALSTAWDEKLDERIADVEDPWAGEPEPAVPETGREPAPGGAAETAGETALADPVASATSPAASRSAFRADALLIHEGELGDVEGLLAALGADAVSQRDAAAAGLAGWERVPRLIVASGRSALRLTLAPSVESEGVVTIAVVESESQTLCGMLRRQGFRFVVRRPVHPEALRLLLGRALFRGRERRDAARVSLGCEVALRFGLRRRPATLIEVSRTGGRVHTNEWVEPGDSLQLRIPEAVTGNRPLALAARVLRSQRQRGGADGLVSVALRFDRLPDATRARLEALIAAHTLGPTPLGRAVAGVPAAAPSIIRAAAARADAERRKSARAPHRREVVALDRALDRVRYALLGVDLSAGGVRVEPHPELALGDRIRIALYEATSPAPILVEAVAVRDDGERGVVLRFRNLDADAQAAVARMAGAAPQIETSHDAARSSLVVAELCERQPA